MRMHAGFAVATGDRERGEDLLEQAHTIDAAALSAIDGGFYRPISAPLEKVETKIFNKAADVADDARDWWRKIW